MGIKKIVIISNEAEIKVILPVGIKMNFLKTKEVEWVFFMLNYLLYAYESVNL